MGQLKAAYKAEGQVARIGPSPEVTGRRLVSFLVSYMFVYATSITGYHWVLSRVYRPTWPVLDGHASS